PTPPPAPPAPPPTNAPPKKTPARKLCSAELRALCEVLRLLLFGVRRLDAALPFRVPHPPRLVRRVGILFFSSRPPVFCHPEEPRDEGSALGLFALPFPLRVPHPSRSLRRVGFLLFLGSS